MVDATTQLSNSDNTDWEMYLDELDLRFPTKELAQEALDKFDKRNVLRLFYRKEVLEPIVQRKRLMGWDDYMEEAVRRFPTVRALESEIAKLKQVLVGIIRQLRGLDDEEGGADDDIFDEFNGYKEDARDDDVEKRSKAKANELLTRIKRYKKEVLPKVKQHSTANGLREGKRIPNGVSFLEKNNVIVRLKRISQVLNVAIDHEEWAEKLSNYAAFFFGENNYFPLPSEISMSLFYRSRNYPQSRFWKRFWEMFFSILPKNIVQKTSTKKDAIQEKRRLLFLWEFGNVEEDDDAFYSEAISHHVIHSQWPTNTELANSNVSNISDADEWSDKLNNLKDTQNTLRNEISLAITDAIDKEMFERGALQMGRGKPYVSAIKIGKD
jgi:hypothetical protein